MKYCTKCGNPFEDVINFCPVCGAEMMKAAALAKNSAETKEEVCENAPVEETKECEQTKCEEVKEEAVCEEVKEEAVCECAEETPEEVAESDAVAETADDYDPNDPNAYYLKPMPEYGKGKCTAGFSLALGLISLLFFWIPGVNVVMFVFSILGIIISSAALKNYRYGAALAGKALSIFALIFNIILVGIFAIAVATKYCTFEGFAAAWKLYSTQATGLIENVGKFLSSLLIAK